MAKVFKTPLEQSSEMEQESKRKQFNDLLSSVLDTNGWWRTSITHQDNNKDVTFTPAKQVPFRRKRDNERYGFDTERSPETTQAVVDFLRKNGIEPTLKDNYGIQELTIDRDTFLNKFGGEW